MSQPPSVSIASFIDVARMRRALPKLVCIEESKRDVRSTCYCYDDWGSQLSHDTTQEPGVCCDTFPVSQGIVDLVFSLVLVVRSDGMLI